jgi:hypothetical protein
MRFEESRLKVKRAYKHISDIDSLLAGFIDSDFYDLTVNKDAESGKNFLRFTFKLGFPAEDYALIIGDALHNLRSALDLLYYETVMLCKGIPTKWTRFPVRDTRDELVSRLNSALEEKRITANVHSLILNVIKPYKTGNPTLWMLDDLNIIDKHQLLVPVLKLVMVSNVCFEDEQQRTILGRFMFTDSTVSLIKDAEGLDLTVKNKGHATAHILLAQDILKQINEVVPTLNRITEEVTRTIETFDILFDGLFILGSGEHQS